MFAELRSISVVEGAYKVPWSESPPCIVSVGTPVMFQKVYGAVVELPPAWFGTAQVNGPEPATLTTSGFAAEGAVR